MQVFVSRPTWVSKEFEEGLNAFITLIENLGLVPRTLGVTDYPSKSPMDEVIEIMQSCKGAVILGYPQLQVTKGTLKGASINSELVLATEWNHLEAGLAYAAGLPLLVLHHTSVTRGVFDRGVLNAFLHSVDFGVPNWAMQPAINGAIKKWKQECVSGSSSYGGANKQKVIPGKPICPNCSGTNKAVYLSPIPSPFNSVAGGDWECSVCKYVE